MSESRLVVAKDKHESPVRTCLGCGQTKKKRDLLRFAVLNGFISVDKHYALPGRGVYCCRLEKCLHFMMKKERKVARAFRCEKLTWHDGILSLLK
jgi:hypothetical protein